MPSKSDKRLLEISQKKIRYGSYRTLFIATTKNPELITSQLLHCANRSSLAIKIGEQLLSVQHQLAY